MTTSDSRQQNQYIERRIWRERETDSKIVCQAVNIVFLLLQQETKKLAVNVKTSEQKENNYV